MTTHDPLTPLLELDPDLGRLLSEARRREAHAELGVRLSHVRRGNWNAERLAAAHPENVGLLVIDGVLAREVLIADTISAELLGAGDILRPWSDGEELRLLLYDVRWTVLADLRMAVLDRRFAARLGRFPEVNAMLIERLIGRARRIAVAQAVSQLNGVDRRLLALFWHLAERWGRITPHGVSVPLAVSHRLLAQLVGARRPTVSTALAELAERRELMRRDDGTWLLTGEPVGVPTTEVERIIEHRRRLLPPERATQSQRPQPDPAAILLRLDRVRQAGELQLQLLRESQVVARELCRRAGELRDRRIRPAVGANGRGPA
jgi:CRP/FNR family transcriptional regulator, cyclic AMP receptor protein